MKRFFIATARGLYPDPESNAWTQYLAVFAESEEDAFRRAGLITGKDLSNNEIFEVFVEEDLRNSFDESRLTHPMIGFKHQTFKDYLKDYRENSNDQDQGR